MIQAVLEWNLESLILGGAMALLGGSLFAITHEMTKWLISKWRSRKG